MPLRGQGIVRRVMEAGGRLRVRSALNPILWLSAIISVPSLVCLSWMETVPTWLIGLTCAPVATAILGFLFLLFFDRDKLQSEDYQLRKRSLELAEQKGDDKPVPVDYLEVIETPNHNKKAIE
jgi:hypothetical protein